MRRDIIYICTEDEVYGKRLLQFLTKKANADIEFGLLTKQENWIHIDNRQNIVGLLIEENEGKVKGPPDFNGKIVQLNAVGERKNPVYIFKYQSAESIYEQILEKYQISDIRPKQSVKKEEVVLIFTPERGKEGFCYPLRKKKNEKAVFISLSALPVCFSEEHTLGLSEGIYLTELMLSLEDENFSERVKESKISKDGLDILPPVRHYKDLLDIRSEDLILFVSRLQKECGYAICYIECGELYEFTFPLFSFVNYIILMVANDHWEEERRNALMRYMRMEGMEHLKGKIIWEKSVESRSRLIIPDLTDQRGEVNFDEYRRDEGGGKEPDIE